MASMLALLCHTDRTHADLNWCAMHNADIYLDMI